MQHVSTFHVPGLGHASHIVAGRDGTAIVVDPARDVRPYLAVAEERGLTLRWVIDTHGHSDYLSGLSALVEHGATPLAPIGAAVSNGGLVTWHGRRLQLDELGMELLHTPGHTPEHTALLVRGASDGPDVLLSGGSLLAGDVGRPDLVGGARAVDAAGEAVVHTILDVLLGLPDETVVLPTHVGGSLCAGAIEPDLVTTIGEQRATNPIVRAMQRDCANVEAWLRPRLLPVAPAFWPTSRAHNLAGVPAPQRGFGVAPERRPLADAVDATVVLDVRDSTQVQAGRFAGSINVPLSGSFALWAGASLPADGSVHVVADTAEQAQRAHDQLLAVRREGVDAWSPAEELAELDAALRDDSPILLVDRAELEGRPLVDVRHPREVDAQPIRSAQPIPAPALLARPDLAPDGPVAFVCASGYRAAVVATAVRRAGRSDVTALVGVSAEELA